MFKSIKLKITHYAELTLVQKLLYYSEIDKKVRFISFRSAAPLPESYRVVHKTLPEKIELDSEYEIEVEAYQPVQPLPYDHGVSFVSLTSSHTKIDQHVMQVKI